jgi:hypothetical protein
MTTLVRPLHTAWAAGHRTVIVLLALAAVLVATVVVAATVAIRRPAVAPAPEPAAPPPLVEDHCTGPVPMLVPAVLFC